MIKAVLFDLDGTLLQMDNDEFIKQYFKGLTAKLVKNGADGNKVAAAVWHGTELMAKSDGSRMNKENFWLGFAEAYGRSPNEKESALFDEFYEKDFDEIKEISAYNEGAREVIDILKSKGIRTVLATNPVFPPIATAKRMSWTGIGFDDFELVTHYENSRFCKPSKGYYLDIIKAIGVLPEECLMVGNDAFEDMMALKLGMDGFLVTDWLINKKNEDISVYRRGSFAELIEYVKSL